MSVPSTPVPERPRCAVAASRRARLGTRDELTAGVAAAAAGLDDGRAVLLLALDLDDFRRYNAEHGYAAGDALLDDVAGRLAGGEGDAFALGADAFAVVLDGTPEALWRRAAAALWALDPGAGGPGLPCSLRAGVVFGGGRAGLCRAARPCCATAAPTRGPRSRRPRTASPRSATARPLSPSATASSS